MDRLRREILPLQGIKSHPGRSDNPAMHPFCSAFPYGKFAYGAVHECVIQKKEDAPATMAFVMAMFGKLIHNHGLGLWIGCGREIYPPALIQFGIAAHQLIFIDLRNERECLWAMEEALKCEGLSAVACEASYLGFTASRRLQLAIEKSGITAFVIRPQSRRKEPTASVAQWKIESLSSSLDDGMPGVGFPKWKVELVKVRNGKPANWEIEFREQQFRQIYRKSTSIADKHRKAV